MINKLKPKSEFSQNILKLASSSTVAIFIAFLTIPIITRLYEPSVFGEFQLLLSVLTLFSVISTFKYEMAIALSKSDKEANYVFTLNLILLILTTIVFLIIFYYFSSWILTLLNAKVLEPYVFLLVIGIFLSGLVQIAREILVRNKKFNVIAKNRVAEVGSSQGIAISIGLVSPNFIGLFISQIAGYIISIFLALRYNNLKVKISLKRLKLVFIKYIDFLKYNTPSVFLNTLSIQLPIFFIAKYFGTEYVGYYMLAIKLIDVPVGVIGGAISQVYYKEAIDRYKVNIYELLSLYKSTLKKLFIIILIPSIVLAFFADKLIIFMLGSNWETTGYIITILIIWKFFQFLISPISTTLTVINMQKVSFYAKLYLSFGLKLGALLVFNDTFEEMIWAISISSAIYYFIFNLLTYYYIRRKTL